MVSNNAATPDLTRLVLFDPQTKKEELVESAIRRTRWTSAAGSFRRRPTSWSERSTSAIRTRTYFRDKDFAADYERVKQKLPGKRGDPCRLDERRAQVDDRRRPSDTEPGARYIFDRDTKALTKQYQVFEKLPRQHLAEHEADPLQVVGRPRDPGLSHAATRRPRRRTCRCHRRSARRSVGARHVRLQRHGAVLRQPRLRGPAAQLPRLAPATARSSSTPATTNGAARCRTTSPGASSTW